MSEPAPESKPSIVNPATPPPPPQEFDLLAFWIQYRRLIIRSFLLVAIIIAGVFGYGFWEKWRENQSREAFAAAKTPDDLRKVIADYSGSNAAASASLQLAEELRKVGDYAGAAKAYEDFASKYPQHSMHGVVLFGLASTLERAAKHDEAITAYQRVIAGHGNSELAAAARVEQARIYKTQGKIEEAKKLLSDEKTLGASGQDAKEILELIENPNSRVTGGTPRPKPEPKTPPPGVTPVPPNPNAPAPNAPPPNTPAPTSPAPATPAPSTPASPTPGPTTPPAPNPAVPSPATPNPIKPAPTTPTPAAPAPAKPNPTAPSPAAPPTPATTPAPAAPTPATPNPTKPASSPSGPSTPTAPQPGPKPPAPAPR